MPSYMRLFVNIIQHRIENHIILYKNYPMYVFYNTVGTENIKELQLEIFLIHLKS